MPCLLEYVQPSQEEYHSLKTRRTEIPHFSQRKDNSHNQQEVKFKLYFHKMNSNKIIWAIIKYQSWALSYFTGSI